MIINYLYYKDFLDKNNNIKIILKLNRIIMILNFRKCYNIKKNKKIID